MPGVKEKHWLVFWTVGGQELKTKERIEKLIKDLNLQDKVESVFVPTVRVTRFVKRKRRPQLVDIIVEGWKDGLPVEFIKFVQSYPVGFTGKFDGDLPYEYEKVGRNVYRFQRVDKYRLEELFKELMERGLSPTILGVNKRKFDVEKEKLSELGLKFRYTKSVIKPAPGQYEMVEDVKIVEKPVYKGYLFIKMEEDQSIIDRITQLISRTRPIRSRDPETGAPTYMKMSEDEIKRIEKLIRQQEEESRRKAPFVEGDKVKIIEGAFKGWSGEVVDVDADKGVVKVRIKEFGRFHDIDFKFSMVERQS